MRTKLNIEYFMSATLMMFTIIPAHGQTNPISGTVNSTLVLTSGCAIDTGSGSTSNGGVFGTLDFGSQPGTFTGSLTAQTTGAGASITQVTCTPDISALNVTVNGGQHANQGAAIGAGTRAVANGSSFVPYEVYADAAHTEAYQIGTAVPVPIASAGTSFNLPIYGVANKTSATSLPSGTYTDVLNVTVGW